MANELDFLFTPGYQTSYDDPDGSKHRAASSIEISGKPGTIEKTLGTLPEGIVPGPGVKSTAVMQREAQQASLVQQNAEVDYLNSLFYSPPSPDADPGMGEISKGVSRGWAQTKSDFAAFGGTLALLGGAEDVANSAFQKAQELADEAKKYPAAISRVEDAFESPGSFVNWAAGMIGEQIPVIASIVAGGGAGGLIGRLVAKGVVSKVAAEQATAKIAQWGLRGATAGVIAGTTAMEGGGMTMEQLEAGVPVTPGTNVLLGSAAGAAEAVSPVLLARMLGLKLPMATRFADHITSTMATKGLLARMGTGAGVIAGVEGGTEAFQEALAIAARSFADENYDVLGAETASRILNAVAGGVLVGGLFGGVGGIRKQPLAAQEVSEPDQLALPPPQLQLPAPTPIGPSDQGGGGTALLAAPEPSIFSNIREGQGLTPEPTILFTENGKESLDPDAIMARTAEITEALSTPEMRTPMQQALLRQVENQRLADFKRLFEMKTPSPALGKLMSLRSTLMEAENVTPVVEAKIDKMSKMIDELATKEEIELPKSNYLSDKENARLAYLIEKDRTDGLSHKEIDSLEKLSAKAGGEKAVGKVPATEANVARLEAEVEEAMQGEGPLYSDTAGSSMTGLSPEEFTKIISGIHNPNIPIDVMEHPAQLKNVPELQKYIMKSGRKVHGAYTNGKVHFFSRNMTAANAVKVYLHEVAHYGLHNVLPADVMKGILQLVEKTNKDWVTTYLAKRKLNINDPAQRARGAEEYVAKIAEDGSNMPVLNKIMAILRRWLRKVMPNLRISDDELRAILADMGRELKGPKTTSKLGPSIKSYRYVLADDEYNTGYTMRVVDRLKKENRDTVSPKYIRQLVKEMKMNDAERSIIEETLTALDMGESEKFSLSVFERELRHRIVPLNAAFTSKYAAYGLDRLGIDADYVEGGATTIYEAPFATGGSHHFPNPNYLGHVRWFTGKGSIDGKLQYIKHIVEMQSDRSQRTKEVMSPEDKALAIQEWQAGLREWWGWINELSGPIENIDSLRIKEIGNAIGSDIGDTMTVITYKEATRNRLIEELSLHIADANRNLIEVQKGPSLEETRLEQMYPTLFKRMLREEIKTTAQQGIGKLRIASAATVARVEGWPLTTSAGQKLVMSQKERSEVQTKPAKIIDFLDDKYKIIAIRHNDLMKWVQAQYTSTLVTDPNGNTWHEVDIHPSYAEKDVMAYFSDAAQAARDVGEQVGENFTLAAKDVEKLTHLWRIKASTIALAPLQLVQRYGVEPLQRYIDKVDNWARTKSEIQAPADDVVEAWMQLPKVDANNLSKALFELTIESDEKERRLTSQEENAILRKYKIEGKTANTYKSITSFFTDILGRLERGLKYNAARETIGNEGAAKQFIADWEATANDSAGRMNLVAKLAIDPGVSINLVRRIQTIEKEMGRLKNRNYFPYMRFGKYTVTSKNAKGEVIGFWTFSSVKEQQAFFTGSEEMKEAKAKGEKVAMSVLTDTQFAFLGMPPEFMETLGKELELSAAQKDQLKEIFIKHSPGRAFLRQLIARKGIEGFSEDAMRVFSTYALNSSNHLARVENYQDMDKALSDFKGLKYEMEERVGDSRGLMTLYNSFQEHRNYIMNPGNELANLRAMGFMWYLGFNVKSALVNMSQVPMVAYPYLASRYGDASSVAELASAIKTAANVFRGKMGYDTTMDQLIARGIREGFLDESLATELAGIAEGSALMRMMPVSQAQRRLNQFSYYGAFFFRNAEKFSRIVAFTAAVKLEQKKGGDVEAMFAAGKETVRSTMFEYAKWNRPQFMRGKKSVFFLFWTFMQNMAYIAGGGQGVQTALRVWIMLGLMAGLQGLPFAENLLDIFDFGNEKIRRALGLKGHYTDLRTEIRELLLTITDNPDMIMHGLARQYGLGPLHLLSMLGVPVPSVDTSGSLSMGKIIPGIGELLGQERNPDEKLGKAIVELAGPVFGMPYALWKAVEDNDPDSWKRFERAMPTAMKSASKAGRYFTRGEEEFRGGGAVAKFSPYNSEQRAEVIAQGFGFTPTRVTQRYELRAAQQMMKEYFTIRRGVLMDDYAFAAGNRDREGLADVRQAIKEYNISVPHPALKIDSESIKKSAEARKKGAAQRESLTPGQKMYRPAFQDVARSYPEGSKLK